MFMTAVIVSSPDEITSMDDLANTLGGLSGGQITGKLIVKYSRDENEFSAPMRSMMLEEDI